MALVAGKYTAARADFSCGAIVQQFQSALGRPNLGGYQRLIKLERSRYRRIALTKSVIALVSCSPLIENY